MATISTEAAVNQLHQMFTDFDKGTLAAVLQASDGSIERAVESLLENHSNLSGTGGGGGGGGPPGTDHDAALALQLSREWGDDPTALPPPPVRPLGIPTPFGRPVAGGGGGREGGKGGGGGVPASGGMGNAQGAVNDRRGRRVALPDKFLRVPGWNAGGEVSSDPQLAADARLAMMLQNQSFQRELQAHPDLAYLGRRSTGWGTTSTAHETTQGPSIREQLTAMGNDVRRELDKLAVRWKMKNPGRVENTADYDSSVPLMSSQGDDLDDQAEVVHFTQDNATRRSHVASGGGGGAGSFAADSGGDELLADPRRSKKDR